MKVPETLHQAQWVEMAKIFALCTYVKVLTLVKVLIKLLYSRKRHSFCNVLQEEVTLLTVGNKLIFGGNVI